MTRIQARDIRPGMIVETANGQGSAVRSMWRSTNRRGAERIGISLANEMVYTNLMPTDPIVMHDPRSNS